MGFNPFETTYKLSQNNIDFVADQLHTIVDGLFPFLSDEEKEDEPFTLPNSFFADGITYLGKGIYEPSYLGTCFGLATCHITLTPDTLSGNGDIFTDWSIHDFQVTQNPIPNSPYPYYFNNSNSNTVNRDYFINSLMSYTLKPSSSPRSSAWSGGEFVAYYNSPWARFTTYNNNSAISYTLDLRPFVLYDFPLSVNTSNYRRFDQTQDTFSVRYYTSTLNTNVNTSLDTSLTKYRYDYTDSSGNSRTVYYTYYDDLSQLTIQRPNFPVSYNDLEGLFNLSIIPTISDILPDIVAPSLTFPSFSEPVQPPFAYIEPVHELNYELEMPDTSEYLDVSVISRPLSICADTFEYLWSNISAFGFAPVLGFCLIATLIIKGLRGD